jgi:hypothetical protein
MGAIERNVSVMAVIFSDKSKKRPATQQELNGRFLLVDYSKGVYNPVKRKFCDFVYFDEIHTVTFSSFSTANLAKRDIGLELVILKVESSWDAK